jgi:hypothetical protein
MRQHVQAPLDEAMRALHESVPAAPVVEPPAVETPDDAAR